MNTKRPTQGARKQISQDEQYEILRRPRVTTDAARTDQRAVPQMDMPIVGPTQRDRIHFLRHFFSHISIEP
jgi:hypothetical protein